MFVYLQRLVKRGFSVEVTYKDGWYTASAQRSPSSYHESTRDNLSDAMEDIYCKAKNELQEAW